MLLDNAKLLAKLINHHASKVHHTLNILDDSISDIIPSLPDKQKVNYYTTLTKQNYKHLNRITQLHDHTRQARTKVS